jgi:hypothetical protein
VTTSIGGDVDLDKLPFLMRGIMKNIAKTEEDKHSPEAGGGDPVPLPGRRILNRAAGRKGRGHIMVDVPGGAISLAERSLRICT